MQRHIGFPSIDQFRTAVKDVTLRATYTGRDMDGNPVYDEALIKPTLRFHGTVKLHGTNAGVSYNPTDGLWFQSREHIITPEQDNAGFARWASGLRDVWDLLFIGLVVRNKLDPTAPGQTFTIFGEWAGQGVNSGVAITQLPKAFYIFGAKLTASGTEGTTPEETWLDIKGLHFPEHRIFNVTDYDTYCLDIDFNNPQDALEDLNRLTWAVEDQCPVAAGLGVSGVGEGIVWTADYLGKRILFKTKGEKHSVARIKDSATIAPEKQASIEDFVAYAVTENRFQQSLVTVFGEPRLADIRRLGEVIKWMNQDILKEESDTLEASGLTWKEVQGTVTTKTRQMFMALTEF